MAYMGDYDNINGTKWTYDYIPTTNIQYGSFIWKTKFIYPDPSIADSIKKSLTIADFKNKK